MEPLNQKIQDVSNWCYSCANSFGFCYDEFIDDYKIIILTSNVENEVSRMEVMIYSCKKKYSYKIDGYLGSGVSQCWHGKYLSGYVYWIVMPYNTYRDTCYIAILDMGNQWHEHINLLMQCLC